MRAPEGTLISYATQPGNVAADGSGANSPYTTALAEAMQTRGVDIFRLFNTVGLQVKRSTSGVQQPWVSTSPIDGDFFFAGPPVAAPQDMAALVRPSSPEPSSPAGPLERLRGIARTRKCSILDVREESGVPVLRGIALGGADWNELLRQAGATRGIRVVTPEVEFVQPFACAAIDVLAPLVRATRDVPGKRLLNLGHTELKMGDSLNLTIAGRVGDTVLLDAFLPDGTVEHVAIPPAQTVPGEFQLSLSRLAGAPGPRLLAAIVAPGRFNIGPRPTVERADVYLARLARALVGADEIRSDVASLTLRAVTPTPVQASVPPNATPRFAPPSRSPRCSAIEERAQLGETPSDGDRAFLQAQCR